MTDGSIDPRDAAVRMFRAALRAADPAACLDRHWERAWAERGIEPGDPSRPVMLLAIGKSSIEMAGTCLARLGRGVEPSVVAAVPERLEAWKKSGAVWPNVDVVPADHPLPTERSVVAAEMIAARVARFAETHGEHGIVVALISGGGSSHMCLPDKGLTLDDLRTINRVLQERGATIHELNRVRRHTERLKGGRLGVLAGKAIVQAFISSDVVGNDLGVIASGPLTPDPTTHAEALAVLERYGADRDCPRVAGHLSRSIAAGQDKAAGHGDRPTRRVRQVVVSSNEDARRGAAEEAKRIGLGVLACEVMPEAVSASRVGRALADRLGAWLNRHPGGVMRGAVMIEGGEPTVDTRDAGGSPGAGAGAGVGGPSQEVALSGAVRAAEAFPDRPVLFASFSTDGIDGPTDAAGAIADKDVIDSGGGLAEAMEALSRHDSHTFLGRAGGLVTTGPTGVNVNHLMLAIVAPGPTFRVPGPG